MKRYFYSLFVFVTIITFSNCEQNEPRSAKNCNKYTAQCTTSDSVTVTRNHTTLLTPPETYFPKTCTFLFPRQPGVCQLRLDFPKFVLNNPEGNGNCVKDSLSIVSGTVTVNNLDICGTGSSAAQHMYLDYGTSDGPIVIRIKTSGGTNMLYGYEIGVTQIMCTSALRVPQDCLQYYKEPSGVVSSFNYDQQQLNSQNYKVCIEKRFPGDRIQWSLCNKTDPTQPPLWMSEDICLQGDGCISTPNLQECKSDYIEIPGSDLFRYCDISQFWRHSTITTESFWIRVNMDDRELQTYPPELWDSTQSCSAFDPNAFPDYDLWESTVNPGGCSFIPRALDLYNKGFCLAYSNN